MGVEGLSLILTAAGLCVGVVNIIVEVLKTFLIKKKEHIPIAATVVSIAVSFMGLWVYCGYKAVAFTPMITVGAVVGGFFIAYGAMFGYEKLYGEVLKNIEENFCKSRDVR